MRVLLLMGKPHFEAGDTIASTPARRAAVHPNKLARFEETVLPHLNAAYNLARWLLRDHHDAEDAVQEAYLRAFRFFDSFDGRDGRAWLLAIVRNRCRTSLQRNAKREITGQLDEETHNQNAHSGAKHLRTQTEDTGSDPESDALRNAEVEMLRSCMEDLPLEYREVVILRELEQMSYQEISVAAGIPAGTVMSRLSRARLKLQSCLGAKLKGVRR